MDIKKTALWAAVFILLGWFTLMIPGPETAINNDGKAKEGQLRAAMLNAVNTIDCGYSDIGYVYYTASKGAENYIRNAESAQKPLPGEHQLPAYPPLEHTLGKAKSPWSIVFVPDDAKSTIRIYGYGNDILNPLLSERIFCEPEAIEIESLTEPP